MDKEYEILADRLIKALKGQNEEQLTLKLISGEVVSSDTGYKKAMIKISSGVEIQAINKSKEQLKAGESVWIGYIKSLADAVVLFKAGASAVRGVGEDLGNGNERFSDYVNNVLLQSFEGNNNSIFGVSNTLDHVAELNGVFGKNHTIAHAADSNLVAGTGNTIYGHKSVICGESNSFNDGMSNAMVCGKENTVGGGVNCIVGGHNNNIGGTDNIIGGAWNVLYSAYYSLIAGLQTKTYGEGNIVSGNSCAAMNKSIAGGDTCIAKNYSAAAGQTSAAGLDSLAIGYHNMAYDHNAAIGQQVIVGTNAVDSDLNSASTDPASTMSTIENKATGGYGSIGVGDDVRVLGTGAAAFGKHLWNEGNGIAGGQANLSQTSHGTGVLILGDGVPVESGGIVPEDDAGRSDCFEVYGGGTGVFAKGAYNTIGADYAEYFEWADGNPDNEDRAGIFVTLEGDKIRPAGIDDDYILGVVSATPSIIGNSDISAWNGKYKRDVFGRLMLDEEGKPIISEDYSNDKQYIPRGQRKEYAAVGMLGQLVVVDDGGCKVGGYCEPGKNGIATATYSRAGYRVIKRLDESHIKIIFR